MTKEQLEGLKTEELIQYQQKLEAQRIDWLALARLLGEILRRRLREEHAAYYGLTADQYDEAKAKAKETGEEFTRTLSLLRKKNAVQVAQTRTANVSVTGKATDAK